MFFFPYAGGGSWIYRSWGKGLPSEIEIFTVQLPGREKRFTEKPYRDIVPMLREMEKEFQSYLDLPFAFFGHSMGALIAFELSRILNHTYGKGPKHLFVSGKTAPQTIAKNSLIYNLPKEQFIQRLRSLNGTPEEVLTNQSLMEIVEPVLRADFELCDTYIYKPDRPLDCPISVFGGKQDNRVSRYDLEEWKELTKNTFTLRMYEGDHFFLHNQHENMEKDIKEDLMMYIQ